MLPTDGIDGCSEGRHAERVVEDAASVEERRRDGEHGLDDLLDLAYERTTPILQLVVHVVLTERVARNQVRPAR